MMREDAERILAFQRVYDEAGRLLYPGDADRAARYLSRVKRIWSRITAIG